MNRKQVCRWTGTHICFKTCYHELCDSTVATNDILIKDIEITVHVSRS